MPDQAIPICTATTNVLYCSIHELVNELEERIQNGEPFDNPKLTETADRIFGGTRAQGKYTARDAYDALEIAVNSYLSEKHARKLMQMDACDALETLAADPDLVGGLVHREVIPARDRDLQPAGRTRRMALLGAIRGNRCAEESARHRAQSRASVGRELSVVASDSTDAKPLVLNHRTAPNCAMGHRHQQHHRSERTSSAVACEPTISRVSASADGAVSTTNIR